MEPTYLWGQARPLLWRLRNPRETQPGGESRRDTGRRRPRALTTSAAVPRLFLSRLGSLSEFSFGPTSGAQRCLIVRDWGPAVPPPRRSAAHAGNARHARRAALRPARRRPAAGLPTVATALCPRVWVVKASPVTPLGARGWFALYPGARAGPSPVSSARGSPGSPLDCGR